MYRIMCDECFIGLVVRKDMCHNVNTVLHLNIKLPLSNQYFSKNLFSRGLVSLFIMVFTVFQLLTDFVCLYTYEF